MPSPKRSFSSSKRQRQWEFKPPPDAGARAIQNYNDKFFDVASSGDYRGTLLRIQAGQNINVLHSS